MADLVKEKRKYKVIAGTHHDGEKEYGPGEIVESDEDLTKKWVNKFARYYEEEEKPKKARKAAKAAAAEEEDEGPDVEAHEETTPKEVLMKETENADKKPRESVPSKLGDEDVTEDFEHAEKNDLLVFKKGRDFFVAENDDPDTAINEEPLKHAGVNKFIKEYLKK